jgi:hypothetical protein
VWVGPRRARRRGCATAPRRRCAGPARSGARRPAWTRPRAPRPGSRRCCATGPRPRARRARSRRARQSATARPIPRPGRRDRRRAGARPPGAPRRRGGPARARRRAGPARHASCEASPTHLGAPFRALLVARHAGPPPRIGVRPAGARTSNNVPPTRVRPRPAAAPNPGRARSPCRRFAVVPGASCHARPEREEAAGVMPCIP